MPAQGDHRTAIIGFANEEAGLFKGDTVQVIRPSQFYPAQVKSEYRRVLPGDVPDITPPGYVLPADTVTGVVLVAKQDIFTGQCIQIFIKRPGFGSRLRITAFL